MLSFLWTKTNYNYWWRIGYLTDPYSQCFSPKIAFWITAGKGRRAEVRRRERRLFSVGWNWSFGGRSLGAQGSAERTRSSRGSAQTHHCGNRNASVSGERSVWSTASVHGSSRRLLNLPTRCSILHLRFKPWEDDRRPQLTGKCLR